MNLIAALFLAFCAPVHSEIDTSGNALRAVNTGLTATGTSLNVNCTGGCGSPTQAATFVVVSTGDVKTNAVHQCLIVRASVKTTKILKVEIRPYSEAAVTGVMTKFDMRMVTALTKGFTSSVSTWTYSSADARTLESTVEVSTAATSITYEMGASITNFPPMASLYVMPDEAPTFIQNPILWSFDNNGGKPITIANGTTRGFCIIQKGVAATAGVVAISTTLTQE